MNRPYVCVQLAGAMALSCSNTQCHYYYDYTLHNYYDTNIIGKCGGCSAQPCARGN